ncbi:MAG TPA: cytochrome P450 [Anaerolineales bacterium]|nr:cytochrome P450 [Anaerolineales bacterium]HRQ91911.1 cytochrome P450 [Anaerolineales bacterium]
MVTPIQTKQPARMAGFPVVGNLPQFARNPIGFLTRLQSELGDVAAFSLLGSRSVLLSHPEDVDRVLVETGKRYNNGKTGNMHALNAILGNGLVASEGDFWRKQRKLMAPSFHHQSIKKYADLIVSATQDLASTWQDGAERDIHEDMMELTQRIIMKALFDVDVQDNAHKASQAFDAMMHALGAEMRGIEAVLPSSIPTPSRTKLKEGIEYINTMLVNIIEERMTSTEEKHDLLTMLMDARDDEDQPMSIQQLLDEIRTLYLAGHETTATTLSWAWLLLSQNPEQYATLQKEVADILQGRTPTADDAQLLPYCNAVIKEALRMYPVAWVTRRMALEDVEIRGFHIEKGTFVFLSPWILHHDPRWFEQPEQFVPERWLKDKAELPAREAYIPFGGGPRICIGNGLAMMESVLVLATLLQRFSVHVLPEQPVEMELAGTMRPKHGLRARLAKAN